MGERLRMAGLVFYAVGVVITFGNAAARHPADPLMVGNTVISKNNEVTVTGSIFAAVAWPLYWSWQVQALSTDGENNG
jgi:hypothetical protein